MKKRILQLFILSLLMAADLYAGVGDTFLATYNGSTLKYSVSSETDKTVAVYGRANVSKVGDHQPGSTCFIPETVTNEEGENYSVTEIGPRAFSNQTEMETVIIPSSVKTIENLAFVGCDKLTTVVFCGCPTSVATGLSTHIFKELTNLERVVYPETYTPPTYLFQMYFLSVLKFTFNPDECVVTDNGEIFSKNRESLYFVPYAQVQDYKIPSSVKKLENVFFKTEITDVEIPDNVEEIGTDTFRSCKNLTQMPIGKNVKIIGYNAFWGAGLTGDLVIPEGIEKIEYQAFSETQINKVTLPNSLKEIGTSTFSRCEELTSVNISESVTKIPTYCFYNCPKLESITIPDNVQSIGESAFLSCSSLESINIPSGVTSIPSRAFEDCSALKLVTLHDNVSYIGASAFKNCSSLENISFPASLNFIGTDAFNGCESFTEVYISPNVTSLGSGAFDGCTGIVRALYPDKFANPFGESTAIAYPSDAKTTEVGLLYSPQTGILYYAPTNLEGEVWIPREVTTIGERSFKGCSKLKEIIIPSEVTEIGNEAFAGTGLEKLIMGCGIKKIGERAFRDVPALETIYLTTLIPPVMGENAFDNKSEIKLNVVKSVYETTSGWSEFNIHTFSAYDELVSDTKSFSLTPGESKQLSVNFVYPYNCKLPYVFWMSSNPATINVDRNGLVTMSNNNIGVQSSTVTAYTLFDNGSVWNFQINQHDEEGVLLFNYGNGVNNESEFIIHDDNADRSGWSFGTPNYSYRVFAGYGTDNSYDDSMITRNSYNLQKGKGYKLVVTAAGVSSMYNEHETMLEVSKFTEGNKDNPEILISETPEYKDYRQPEQFQEYVSYFDVSEDGDYYFRFRALGGPGGMQMYKMNLSEFDTNMYPASATELTAIVGEEDMLSAAVEFRLPSKSIYGSALSDNAITRVEIFRENELVATLRENLIPGEKIKWTDLNPVEGINNYSVIVYNVNLASEPVEVKGNIIDMTPTPVTDLTVKKVAGGKNLVTWKAPLKSAEDFDIDPAALKYVVKRIVDNGTAVTLATIEVLTEYEDSFNPQDITKVKYTVEAVIKNRVSEAVSSEELILSLYNLPYQESFANANTYRKLPEDWPSVRYDGYKENPTDWSTDYYKNFGGSNCRPFDSDKGFLMFDVNSRLGKAGDWCDVYSPEIEVSGGGNVGLEFYFFHTDEEPECDDRMEIYVSENRGEFARLEDHIIHRYAEESGWIKHLIILDKSEDTETLQFCFRGISDGGPGFALDALKLNPIIEYDLEISEIEVNTSVVAGSEVSGILRINNNGSKDVEGNSYEVRLYKDSELFGRYAGDDLLPGEEKEISFSFPVNLCHVEDGIDIEAEVIFSADMDKSNNFSSVINIEVGPYYTAPAKIEEIDGEVDGDTLRLFWKHIDAQPFDQSESVINFDSDEDVISKESFTADNSVITPQSFIGVDGKSWRNVDNDGGELVEKYGIPGGKRGFAYVSKSLFEEFPFTSYDGKEDHGMLYCQAPASVYGSDYLISPILPGVGSHTIRFMARSISASCYLGVAYTTEENFSDEKIAELFVPVDEDEPYLYLSSGRWSSVSYNLPADAKYVAIHVKTLYRRGDGSVDEVCIDNIQLTSKPIDQPTYNVYCREKDASDGYDYYSANSVTMSSKVADNKLILHNEEPIVTGEYVVEIPLNDTDFHVSTVYPKGETELSAPYSFSLRDIPTGDISPVSDSQVRIRVERRKISAVCRGEQVAVTVYEIDGALVAKDVESFVAGKPGAYIVKAGETSVTVIVR